MAEVFPRISYRYRSAICSTGASSMSSVERRRVPAIKILADCSQRWIRAVSGDTGAVRYGKDNKGIYKF